MRTKYRQGFTQTGTRILSATAKSKTVPTSESAMSMACSTRGPCPIGPASSLPCHLWFRKKTKEVVTRGQCTHYRTTAARNFAISGTRRKFSKSVAKTTRSRGYLNEEQRYMAPENYSSSGEIILQNKIRKLVSKIWAINHSYTGMCIFNCKHSC